jgi:DNA-directed RNA polymerase specialized sigma24 family protein
VHSDDGIVSRVLKGDSSAWMSLFSKYAPIITALARTNRSMGSYRGSEDDVRNVMTSVFERLRRDDYRALRTFGPWRAANPTKAFNDWLTIVTVNVIRNYIAKKLGAPRADKTSAKQLVITFANELKVDGDEPLVLPHMTTRESANQILEFARDHLAEEQMAVLAGWLEGSTFDELAVELGLADARAADKLLRSSLAKLRRHFGSQT